jgi:hypothetical protein
MPEKRIEHNRLLLQVDKRIREINRDVLNPAIKELTLTDLEPVMELVARTRAAYLKELFAVTEMVGNGLPSPEQLRQLASYRLMYEELQKGAQALDTALERGYLDVLP